MIIRSVNVVSIGKLFGALYAILGLFIGAILTLITIAGAAIAAKNGNDGFAAIFLGAGAVIIFPVFYGTIGFIGGLILGLIYNVAASVVGGIELDIVPVRHDTFSKT